MSNIIIQQVREAISHLDPAEVRQAAERPVTVRITAVSSAGYASIEDFLAPRTISRRKRYEIVQSLFRNGDVGAPAEVDLEICEEGVPGGESAFRMDRSRPGALVSSVLEAREDLGLALARSFPPFRRPVIERVVLGIARENAVFSLMTSLPHLAPKLSLPFPVPSSVSDTAFLTVNQIRMAFLLSAASDRPVGYREQKTEVASLITTAFCWRALARKLCGTFGFSGGILPKAAVAYAATYATGLSLERLYRTGYGLTRNERRLAYGEALARGRQIGLAVWSAWRERAAGLRYASALRPRLP